jgi:hypothetical protein
MKMDVALALTVILNAVKDLLYDFDPLKPTKADSSSLRSSE